MKRRARLHDVLRKRRALQKTHVNAWVLFWCFLLLLIFNTGFVLASIVGGKLFLSREGIASTLFLLLILAVAIQAFRSGRRAAKALKTFDLDSSAASEPLGKLTSFMLPFWWD